MKVTVLFNPGAGRGRAREKIGTVMRNLDRRADEVTLLTSRDPAHLTQLARDAARNGADCIVLCGGDGSLNLAIREMDLSRATLGIIPMGSGDDFAQALGLPRDTEAACDVIFDGIPREVDVALVNGRRFLGVAGLGFDSQVARQANRVRMLRGSLVYLYAIFRVLPGFRPHKVSVAVDGVQRDEELMFVVVANSTRYGGGVHIAPSAELDDGMLDMVLVRKSTIFDLLTTLPMAYKGTHIRRSYVICERGKTFDFESAEVLEIYADGERLATTPATIELESERLRLMVPRP